MLPDEQRKLIQYTVHLTLTFRYAMQHESGAMLLYIADAFGETASPQERAKAAQWLLFGQSLVRPSMSVIQLFERWFVHQLVMTSTGVCMIY